MTPSQCMWSLYEMLRFYADFFTRACLELERIRELMQRDSWRVDVDLAVSAVKGECERIGFRHLANQAQRIIEKTHRTKIYSGAAVLAGEGHEKNEIAILSHELRLGIEQKLKFCMFLRVHTDRIDFYSDDDLPLFGDNVRKKFGEATHDIAEAGRCFALERWDGTVYHLMLATEHALRKWARNMKVKTKGRPLDLLDWKPIIDCAEDRLKYLKNLKKNTKRANTIERLASQLAHFSFIKDAYRNVCSHGRAPYNELKATSIMNHVRAFMQSLT